MASNDANSGAQGPGWTNYFKGVLGLKAEGPAPSPFMGQVAGAAHLNPGAQSSQQGTSTQGGNGSTQGGNGSSPVHMPSPIRTAHPDFRQDSMPEMVSTPTDVGIWEVSHGGPKFTWKRLFQDPRTYSTRDMGNGGASPSSK